MAKGCASMTWLVISGVILVASLAVLAKASHLAIVSIEDLIELTGLSEASAGFVILAVMTSIPEMTVAVFAVLQGAPGISVGGLLGSNMFNIGIVIGIMAMIGPLEKVSSDFLIEMGCSVPFFSNSDSFGDPFSLREIAGGRSYSRYYSYRDFCVHRFSNCQDSKGATG